jgi:hypothetical protein
LQRGNEEIRARTDKACPRFAPGEPLPAARLSIYSLIACRSKIQLGRPGARSGRIFLDYLRNGRGNTAAGAYSPRVKAGFPIAAPVTWAKVENRSIAISGEELSQEAGEFDRLLVSRPMPGSLDDCPAQVAGNFLQKRSSR